MKTTTKTSKPFWIKERHNPQLGVYYVPEGQLSKTAARKKETGGCYGYNTMLRYETEAEYEAAIAKLRADGHRVY